MGIVLSEKIRKGTSNIGMSVRNQGKAGTSRPANPKPAPYGRVTKHPPAGQRRKGKNYVVFFD